MGENAEAEFLRGCSPEFLPVQCICDSQDPVATAAQDIMFASHAEARKRKVQAAAQKKKEPDTQMAILAKQLDSCEWLENNGKKHTVDEVIDDQKKTGRRFKYRKANSTGKNELPSQHDSMLMTDKYLVESAGDSESDLDKYLHSDYDQKEEEAEAAEAAKEAVASEAAVAGSDMSFNTSVLIPVLPDIANVSAGAPSRCSHHRHANIKKNYKEPESVDTEEERFDEEEELTELEANGQGWEILNGRNGQTPTKYDRIKRTD